MILALIDPDFARANYIEAGLWMTIGVGFVIHVLLKTAFRRVCTISAITFLLFGGSDIVEAHTGAWWRPWWLFGWKAACVLVFLILLINYVRWRRASKSLATNTHE